MLSYTTCISFCFTLFRIWDIRLVVFVFEMTDIQLVMAEMIDHMLIPHFLNAHLFHLFFNNEVIGNPVYKMGAATRALSI
jgi:hypothetical protein